MIKHYGISDPTYWRYSKLAVTLMDEDKRWVMSKYFDKPSSKCFPIK